MMQLPKIVERSKKRIGRGHGSGKVKTSGRGTKGQKARGKIRAGFEGGQLPLVKRLPYLRGKGKNKGVTVKAQSVQLADIDTLPSGSVITVAFLEKHNIVSKGVQKVKILGNAAIKNAYKVEVPCSAAAKRALEQAGGSVK